MSEFFDSEIVQDELREINDLQQEIYGDLTDFPTLPDEKKKEHILKLTELLDRQRVMYTRPVSYTHLTLPTIYSV